MKYYSCSEAAAFWHVSDRRVRAYCADGKIPGVQRSGGRWLIPADAYPPEDGRTRAGRQRSQKPRYHFPVFTFHYAPVDPDSLLEDERELYHASDAFMRARREETYFICRSLTMRSGVSEHVLAGALYYLAYSCALLGLSAEQTSALQRLRAMAGSNTEHGEDYRLLLLHLSFIIPDEKPEPIPFSELIRLASPEAVPFAVAYYALSGLAKLSCGEAYPADEMELLCRCAGAYPQHPSAALLHMSIAVYYQSIGNREALEGHLRRGLDIALKHGWMQLVMIFTFYLHRYIDDELVRRDSPYLSQYRELCFHYEPNRFAPDGEK